MSSRFALIIPAYRESERLPGYLASLLQGFALDSGIRTAEVTIHVVDDGSPPADFERTRNAIEGLNREFGKNIELWRLEENQGKGGAILNGWRRVDGAEYYAFSDADGAVPAGEIIRMMHQSMGSEVPKAWFASRVVMLGRQVERRFKRHLVGRIFASLVGVLIEPGVYDSQCGFKIIPGPLLLPVLGRLQGNRYAFDVELLAALRQNGCCVEEFPVDWQDIPGSKVRLLRDSLMMFCSLWQIHKRIKNGYYRI